MQIKKSLKNINFRIYQKRKLKKYVANGAQAVNTAKKEQKLIKDVFNELSQLNAVSDSDEMIKKELEKMGVDRNIITNQVVAVYSMLLQAKKGNTKAFELYRNSIGEMPIEKKEVSIDKKLEDVL